MRRFVGVGIDQYEHFEELSAIADVNKVAAQLGRLSFDSRTFADVTDGEAEELFTGTLADPALAGGAVIVLWSGHGEPTVDNELRLITRSARPAAPATRTARQLVTFAMAGRPRQLLVVLDTCLGHRAGGGGDGGEPVA